MSQPSPPVQRRGAVAVICQESRLLVIRRSRHVRAPGMLCFPGGGIEAGETESEALIRELREELGVAVEPLSRLWHSVTPWGVDLAWWQANLLPDPPVIPNPAEVESCHWYTPDEMRALPDLLSSNLAFLDALDGGEFELV